MKLGRILSNDKFVKVLDLLASGQTTHSIVKAVGVSSSTVWGLANELPLWKAAREVCRKAVQRSF